jgi:hypothetical protein
MTKNTNAMQAAKNFTFTTPKVIQTCDTPQRSALDSNMQCGNTCGEVVVIHMAKTAFVQHGL